MAVYSRRIRSVLIGIISGLWVLLACAGALWGLQNEEVKIRRAIVHDLVAGGLLPDELDVEGRDVTLVGGDAISQAERTRVEASVRQVAGVRTVRWEDLPPTDVSQEAVGGSTASTQPTSTFATTTSQVPTTTATTTTTTTTTEPPPPTEVHLAATLENGVLTLAGAVDDVASAAKITDAAQLVYGPFVVGEIVVDESLASADWVTDAGQVISILALTSKSTLDIVGDRAILSGDTATDLKRTQLHATIASALGTSGSVRSTVNITNLTQPSYYASAAGDGTVSIGGVMPDQEIVDRIVSAGEAVYGAGNIINELSVGVGIEASFAMHRIPLTFVESISDSAWTIELEGDTFSSTVGGDGTFQSGSAVLSDGIAVLLNTAASIMLGDPTLVGVATGHTDNLGDAGFNQALSEARAEAIINYLIAAGVNPSALTAVGSGESQPLADNATEQGRRLNRRVELVLGPPEGG